MAVPIGAYVHPTYPYQTRNVYTGFSWTTLFFGFWPAALRQDVRGALTALALPGGTVMIWGLAYVLWLLLPSFSLGPLDSATYGAIVLLLIPVAFVVGLVVFANGYNDWHARRLRDHGWVAVGRVRQ